MPSRITGGWTTLQLTNSGRERHEFAHYRLSPGKGLADVRRVLADPKTAQTGPPDWVEAVPGIPTLESGETAALTERLEPGRYALICFIRDPSGKPHFADGMVRVVDVTGDAGAEPPATDAKLTLGKGLTAPMPRGCAAPPPAASTAAPSTCRRTRPST